MIRVFGPVLAAIIVMLSFGLHSVKLDAKHAYEENQRVKVAIMKEEQAIQILAAEWSHLNQPAKLKRMSDKFLELEDVRATQIVVFEDIPYMGLDLFEDEAPLIGLVEAPEMTLPDLLVEIQSSEGGLRP